MTASRYFVRQSQVPGFVPENHDGTINKRLISSETVGAQWMEVVLGVVGGTGATAGGGARLHRHAGVEQANYILEGRARVEIGGEVEELGPGDMCFFPADTDHSFTRICNGPVKVLVIYSFPQRAPQP